MNTPRSFVIQVLEQITKLMQEMSNEDFERLMKGELQPSISFSRLAPRAPERKKQTIPVSEEALRKVHEKLTGASSREEGQSIVCEAFEDKEELFVFAKFLDLPVQRKDKAERIRDKIVTHTVGRRLSGEAVRGGFGKE